MISSVGENRPLDRVLSRTGKAETVVISIVGETGRQEFNSRADRMLAAGDTLLVVCREGGLERLAGLG